jgi:hypothetical protein
MLKLGGDIKRSREGFGIESICVFYDVQSMKRPTLLEGSHSAKNALVESLVREEFLHSIRGQWALRAQPDGLSQDSAVTAANEVKQLMDGTHLKPFEIVPGEDSVTQDNRTNARSKRQVVA